MISGGTRSRSSEASRVENGVVDVRSTMLSTHAYDRKRRVSAMMNPCVVTANPPHDAMTVPGTVKTLTSANAPANGTTINARENAHVSGTRAIARTMPKMMSEVINEETFMAVVASTTNASTQSILTRGSIRCTNESRLEYLSMKSCCTRNYAVIMLFIA